MKTLTYTAGALAASAAFIAFAAPASAQAVNPTFTGPRVEAIVGYDINKAGSDIDDDLNDNNDQSFEGVLYGGAIGYDFAFGGVVVGADNGCPLSTPINCDAVGEGHSSVPKLDRTNSRKGDGSCAPAPSSRLPVSSSVTVAANSRRSAVTARRDSNSSVGSGRTE